LGHGLRPKANFQQRKLANGVMQPSPKSKIVRHSDLAICKKPSK
jgi:hypothetical protein